MQLPIETAPKPKWIRGSIPRVDWSHPLTQGLIGCWVPGAARGWDLTGNTPALILSSSGAGVSQVAVGPEGVGLNSLKNGGSGFSYAYGLASPSAKNALVTGGLFRYIGADLSDQLSTRRQIMVIISVSRMTTRRTRRIQSSL